MKRPSAGRCEASSAGTSRYAVLVDDGALLIAGDSGAGKSALVATLMRTGSPVVADGYIFVDAGAPPTVRVTSTKVGLPPDGHAGTWGKRSRLWA